MIATSSDGALYLGPYETWNFGDGKPYTFPIFTEDTKYLTALVELVPQAASSLLGPTSQTDPMEPGKIWFPVLWTGPTTNALTFVPFVISNSQRHAVTLEGLKELFRFIPVSHFTDVVRPRQGISQLRYRVAFPVPHSAMDVREGPLAPPNWSGDPGLPARESGRHLTVIAIIDDGIPFAHRNFRNAAGDRTRVEFCWLQSAPHDPDEQRHSPVRFGRELTRDEINGLIRDYKHDEDELYRAAGAAEDTEGFGAGINRHASHGAHVMDLATGYPPGHEHPPEDVRIIAVQLPSTIAWDTSSFGKDMYMLSAFHYIFERADRIAAAYGEPQLRLVINFSYGFSGGPHDGESELEAAIEEMVQARRAEGCPTALVLPAGNTFADRTHARVEYLSGGQVLLPWRIQPNDRTSSYLEIWFDEKLEQSTVRVQVCHPDGDKAKATYVEANAKNSAADPLRTIPIEIQNEVVGQLTVDKHRRERWRVMVTLAPTEPENPNAPAAPAGLWTVTISSDKPQKTAVRCWIQRDTDPETLRSGSRQSYFDDPANSRFDETGAPLEDDSEASIVKRFGSMNGLATAASTIAVAGFRHHTSTDGDRPRPARYSSAGTGKTSWPDKAVGASSLSDRSDILPGTIAAGTRSGALSLVQGTSTAAPSVARALVEAFRITDDQAIKQAESENYLSLLNSSHSPGKANEVRLGAYRVAPHRQPGVSDE